MIESDVVGRELISTEPRTRTVGDERSSYVTSLVTGDAIALFLGFALAHWLRFYVEITVAPGIPPSWHIYFPLILALIPLWLLIFAALRLYDIHSLLGGLSEYSRVVNACTSGMMLVIVASFLIEDFDVSRAWLVMAWVLTAVLVLSFRLLARRVVYSYRERGQFLSRAVIVGTNPEAIALAEQLQNSSQSGLHILGYVTPSAGAQVGAPGFNMPVVASLDSIGSAIERLGLDEVIVASSALNAEQLLMLTQQISADSDVGLRLSSGLYEVLTTGMQVSNVASVPLMTVSRLRLSRLESLCKTGLDLSVILLLSPLLLPLFAVLALVVRFDSPGPIFYRRRVIGVGGREFDALKFRSMYIDGDARLAARPELQAQLAAEHKLKDDPRVTRAGMWMRRLSLDELPQLINVLRGDMSLVGPRMIHPSEGEMYGRMKANLLTVKPGLTGMWQVSGRSDLSYEERVRLDMVYVRNYSIWLDLQILFFQTLPAVLKGSGAY